MNSIDAVAVAVTLALGLYNFAKFIKQEEMRTLFIVAFYILAFFCLTSWLITAIAQAVKPETRYLVFQK